MNDQKLRRGEWIVRKVSLDVAVNLVEREHYSGGASNTAVARHGLFRAGHEFFDSMCIGVAIWLPPAGKAAAATFPEDPTGVLALSRLAIEDDAPKNAASFLLAASMRLIDRRIWPCFVTYADLWRGHTGAIYRATNWEYCGLTRATRIYTVDGRMTATQSAGKTRSHDEMLALGAVCLGKFHKHKFRHVARKA